MFDLAQFIKENLITACRERSFTPAQVNIFALNYKDKAQITDIDFAEIVDVTNKVQTEIKTEEEARRLVEDANNPPEEPIV